MMDFAAAADRSISLPLDRSLSMRSVSATVEFSAAPALHAREGDAGTPHRNLGKEDIYGLERKAPLVR